MYGKMLFFHFHQCYWLSLEFEWYLWRMQSTIMWPKILISAIFYQLVKNLKNSVLPFYDLFNLRKRKHSFFYVSPIKIFKNKLFWTKQSKNVFSSFIQLSVCSNLVHYKTHVENVQSQKQYTYHIIEYGQHFTIFFNLISINVVRE